MFNIGAKVVTTDTLEGRLTQLVLDPHSHDVTDLVVSLDKGDDRHVVSVADVGYVDHDGVRLNITSEQLARRRRFSQEEMLVPAAPAPAPAEGGAYLVWASPYQGANPSVGALTRPMTRVQVSQGVGDRAAVIGRETPVYIRGGGRVGTVDHLGVDPETYRPEAIVVRLPGIRRRRVVVPAAAVAAWERAAIVLDLTRDQLKALPPFTSHCADKDVANNVTHAVRDAQVGVRGLQVNCDEGHVSIRGHVRSTEERRAADKAARQIDGVLSLHNGLTTDRTLQTRVAAQLDADSIAGLYPVDVTVSEGVVSVQGKVPNSAIRHIVMDAVEDTPGVVEAVDDLEERPEDFDDEPPAAAAPAPGS